MRNLLLAILAVVITFSMTVTAEAQGKGKRRAKEDKVVDDFQRSFKRKYGTAGCGLGSLAFGSKPGFIQVLAATSNGVGYNQLFGISSGTSNCIGASSGSAMQKMDIFLEHNKNQVAADLSRGQGETVAAMAHILGCSKSEKLGSALKTNFSSVYTSESASINDITDGVVTVIINDQELSADCKNLNDIG